MTWKDKPYWLKIGVWFGIVYLVTAAITGLTLLTDPNNLPGFWNIFLIPSVPGFIFGFFTGLVQISLFLVEGPVSNQGSLPDTIAKAFIIITNLIFYFIIGAAIGSIVSKFKKK